MSDIDYHIRRPDNSVKYKRGKYVVLKHKNGFYLPIIETPYSKSLMRLRSKILSNDIEWDWHIVFTFTDKYTVYSKGGYVWSEQFYIGTDGNIHKLRTYIRSPKLEYFNRTLPLNWKVDGTFLKPILGALRKLSKRKIYYCWKYEEGGKTGRPHFHVLLKMGGLCTFCCWSLLNELWEYGRVEVRRIITRMQLEVYIYKDFTKTNQSEYLNDFRRKWSTSRNIKARPKGKANCKWSNCLGPKNAFKLWKSTLPNFIKYYESPTYDINAIANKITNRLLKDIHRYQRFHE